MALLKSFEGKKDANRNEKSLATLQMTKGKRVQFVDLFSIGFVNKLMSAKELETRVGEVSRDMLESEKSLQTTSQEAEEATKLCHQREQKRNAAKAALEMARIKLRQ
nr:hypothetical protein CFP56_51443 [Quercus suber]